MDLEIWGGFICALCQGGLSEVFFRLLKWSLFWIVDDVILGFGLLVVGLRELV